jgi:hypothetical protein
LYVACSADNNGASGGPSISGISDSAGNTWVLRNDYVTQDPGAAGAGITLGVWTCAVTNTLSSGIVTVSFNPATTSKALVVWKVVPDAGQTVAFVSAGVGVVGISTSMSAGAVGVTNGHTIFGATATESTTAAVGDADTTNGNWSSVYAATASTGTFSTSASLSSQCKTVTATGDQTYNTTLTIARDYAINYLILRALVNVAPIGVSGAGQVGTIVVSNWTIVDDAQAAGWGNINDSQSPNWAPVNSPQTPGWVDVDVLD